MVTAPARRELVRWMQARGLSERRCLAITGMSASSLRYRPRPDRNVALRARIVALAQRHRRYGVGMIHLKLRQAGEPVNYKRVERLYRLEQLHIRRRRRKKIPVSECQPLVRLGRANEVWSMDFMFDREAPRTSVMAGIRTRFLTAADLMPILPVILLVAFDSLRSRPPRRGWRPAWAAAFLGVLLFNLWVLGPVAAGRTGPYGRSTCTAAPRCLCSATRWTNPGSWLCCGCWGRWGRWPGTGDGRPRRPHAGGKRPFCWRQQWSADW